MTLLTDFGTRDYYVAAMKAVLVGECSEVRLIDITHHVPRHDILCASITLERAIDGFLPGTVHLTVVDPGVGSDRRILIVEINRQTVVCPDNGLITWAWQRIGGARAYELTWRPGQSSSTFHGRDIMAPAAAMLARGEPVEKMARPIAKPILLDLEPCTGSRARIVHVDVFGNATTNMDYETAQRFSGKSFRVGDHRLGPLHRTYVDVAPGTALALIGSSGLLEIAVRDGSAEDQLGLRVGDIVSVE